MTPQLSPYILIVDDDESMCHALARIVRRMNCHVQTAGTLQAGMTLAARSNFDLVFLDVKLPDGNGLSMLKPLAELPCRPEVIIITGQGDPEGAELAISNGAWDYIEKTYSVQKISLTLKRALDYRAARRGNDQCFGAECLCRDKIVGKSPALISALDLVGRAAQEESNVLITGETGTGKELFSRAIHQNSARNSGAFVIVDCATLPENLALSILFGHKKGAFTGADKDETGLIMQADGGTLFLDEIGELPPTVQKNFLRVLQERSVRAVGDTKERKSNFRLVAATNRNLENMAAEGQFRQDLFYRLRSIHIHLPPLRERNGDIHLLTNHFIELRGERANGVTKPCSTDFLEMLESHDWPGNVRELIHTLEHAALAARLDPYFYPQHLPAAIRAKATRNQLQTAEKQERPHATEASLGSEMPLLQDYREEIWNKAERHYLQRVLDSTQGNIKEAIRLSGLSQSRLYALLKKHALPGQATNKDKNR